MVNDNPQDCRSEWIAFTAILKLFGISPETLEAWVRTSEVDIYLRWMRFEEPARYYHGQIETPEQMLYKWRVND
jgi:hypothetical protein